MRIIHSHELASSSIPDLSPELMAILQRISQEQLREWVRSIAVPRHFLSESEQNRSLAKWLSLTFGDLGYSVE